MAEIGIRIVQSVIVAVLILGVVVIAVMLSLNTVENIYTPESISDSNTFYTFTSIPESFSYKIEEIDSIQTNNLTWLDFDGTSDLINVTDTASLYVNTTATWIFWVNQDTNLSNNDGVLSKYSTVPGQRAWEIQLNNGGKVTLYMTANGSSGSGLTSTGGSDCGIPSAQFNEWHLIALNYNGTHIYYYKDGVNCDNDATPITSLWDSTRPLTVGFGGQVSSYLDGSLDEIKIYNRTFNAVQMARIFNESRYGSNFGRGIPALSYHQIEDNEGAGDTIASIADFNETMTWLYNNGWNTITYDDWYNWTKGLYLLPEKPIIIVFDDGRKNVYTNATPIMDDYGFVGVMNVITSYPDSGNVLYMTWTQIDDLKDKGWQIGSHSFSHCDFITGCNTTAEWNTEFNVSRQHIQGNLSITPTLFVYPYNSNNNTSDDICDDYYSMCSGYSSGTNTASVLNFKNANHTHESGFPVGMRRVIVYNTTTLADITEAIDDYSGQVINLKLNENSGTTAYDASPNSNDGTIDGATWQDDGNLIDLVSSDYLISGNLFYLLNDDYDASEIEVSYTYEQEDVSNMIKNVTTSQTDFFTNLPTIFTLLGGVVVLLIVGIIIAVISSKILRSGGEL